MNKIILIIYLLFTFQICYSAITEDQRPNILHIVIDDLRPEINAYNPINNIKIHTPNLDKLSNESLVFHRAYAQ